MDAEKATAWLKFLRELTATILVYVFAIYSGYTLIKNHEVRIPALAAAVEAHVRATVLTDSALVTNSEELTRIAQESCKTLKYIAKQDARACEIRRVVLGNTIVP